MSTRFHVHISSAAPASDSAPAPIWSGEVDGRESLARPLQQACTAVGVDASLYTLTCPSSVAAVNTHTALDALNLPQSASLLLLRKSRKARPAPDAVKVAVRCHDMQQRFTGRVRTSTSLWQILTHIGEANNVNLCYRVEDAKCFLPRLTISGAEYSGLECLQRLNLCMLGLEYECGIILQLFLSDDSNMTEQKLLEQIQRIGGDIEAERAAWKQQEKSDAGKRAQDKMELDSAAVERQLIDPTNVPDVDICERDFEHWRSETEKKSGSIDRELYNLQQECDEDSEAHSVALKTLLGITMNLIRNPDDQRYHSVRLSNPVLCQRVARFRAGVQYLRLIGFEPAADGETLAIPAVTSRKPLLEKAAMLVKRHVEKREEIARIHRTKKQLADQAELNRRMREESGAEIDLDMKVFDERLGIEANPNLASPDEDFEDSKEDAYLVRRAAAESAKKMATAQMLMSQTYLQEQKLLSTPHFTVARIRVRMDEHVLLQGNFRPGDTVSSVYAVVRSLLRQPSVQFRLQLPPSQVLLEADSRCLRSLGLVPSALLIFAVEPPHQKPAEVMLTEEAFAQRTKLTFDPAPDAVGPAVRQSRLPEPTSKRRTGSAGVPAWFKRR